MRFIALPLAALALAGCTTMHIRESNFIRADKPGAAPADVRLDTQALLPATRVVDAEIATGDGATLRGVIARQPGATVTVLYFGGNAFHLDRHGAELLPLLASCGASVAVFDYRGYGRSSGTPTVANMAGDAVRVFDYVSAQQQGRVIVHGQSLGSFMAAHVAHERPQAAGLVLEATATTVPAWANANVPWYARPFLKLQLAESLQGIDNVAAVAGYPGGALVLAGEQDAVTPPRLGRRVYEALPAAHKTWMLVDGASHNSIFGSAKVMPGYCAFVNGGA